MEKKNYRLFSNEIVFRGHPDKCCDQIASAILDEYLKRDPYVRAGIECALKNDLIYVFGEITSSAKIDKNLREAIARRVLKDIGYTNTFRYMENISEQSRDIAQGVDVQGAGDQGIIYGYACNDTKELLPTAQVILIKFAREYDKLVHSDGAIFYPDGKSQITGEYDENFKLRKIKTFLVSYQNCETRRKESDKIIKSLIERICKEYNIEVENILINPTGKFLEGGPWADSGLTGRKIVVDAYQGFAPVGGGSVNAKDPTKVDYSAALEARELAKRVLTKNGLKWCQVQLSYAIGVARPMAIYIDSDKGFIEPTEDMYVECEPSNIIKNLSLRVPDHEKKSRFGLFAPEVEEDQFIRRLIEFSLFFVDINSFALYNIRE